MFEIQDTIVSRLVVDTFFCCDLDLCKGACCIHGDSGAPILDQEKALLLEAFPCVADLLPKKNLDYIESEGLMYYDEEDDLVTQIISGQECVFTCYEKDGSCRCAFEKAYALGRNDTFYKPISCHLYPIRLTRYNDFIAVNYHEWSICKGALLKGRREGIRLYEFLEGPLVRAFGEEWYEELKDVAQKYLLDREASVQALDVRGAGEKE